MTAPRIVPASRPQLTRERAVALLAAHGVSVSAAPALLGMRGYYRDTMGVPGVQERGIYDDAMAVVAPSTFCAFNANVDPSRTGGRLAVLQPGVYRYREGWHHPGTVAEYRCLVQDGPVTVRRDNGVVESGEFYIHIHRGGFTTTSSEGCQTIHPDQWDEFFTLARLVMEQADVTAIPYVLVEAVG